MRRLTPLFAGLTVLPIVAACNPAEIAKLDPGADATARAAYRHAAKGEDAPFEAMLEPAQRGPQVYRVLDQIRTLIPPGEPDSSETVSWNNIVGTGGRVITLVQTYRYGDRTVAATVVMVPDKTESGGNSPAQPRQNAWLIRSFNVNLQLGAGTPSDRPAEPRAPFADAGPLKPV